MADLHPEHPSYTAVYDAMGLLGERTILAHGIYLKREERELLHNRCAVVAHCPMSNSMLSSGILNVQRLLHEGVRVTLGTDVSGGASPSMLMAIREALKVSNLVAVSENTAECRWAPLRYAEAFWLATVSGAKALGWEHLTGDFSVGSDFDAVAVDPMATGGPFDLYDGEDASDAFQKWLQLGDDRNTAAVWVHGRQVL